MSSLEVIVLAAGQGTRMKSDLPKVLHPLAGRPLLAHVLNTGRALSPERLHVVYGHGGEKVRDALAAPDISWWKQEQQLGTGHAVEQAIPGLGEEGVALILYGDVPLVGTDTLKRLVDAASNGTLAVLTAILDDPSGYGRIIRDSDNKVTCIVEHKDANDAERTIREINTGMMAMPIKRLRGWIKALDNNNAQGEFYLTDIIAMAAEQGFQVEGVVVDDVNETHGINDRVQLAQMERLYQQRQAEQLMREGVTLLDPSRFDLRGTLKCGKDISIDANVIIEGEVTLGDRVSIGAGCVIKNCSIGGDVTIHPMSVLEDARIGNECQIGPFARIRPDTELGAGARVGNFVEIKKSVIGHGSKVNHLSYIGDTEMGSEVNVGAGTITCNYDGANKHKTVIGDRVFIGSDSQLVAPVEVADEATIGAGSTITKDVPAGELTLSRNKQITVKGWKRPTKKRS